MDGVPLRTPAAVQEAEEDLTVTVPDYLTTLQDTQYEFVLENWVLTGLQSRFTSQPRPPACSASSGPPPSCPPYWMTLTSSQQSHSSDVWEFNPRQRSHSLNRSVQRSQPVVSGEGGVCRGHEGQPAPRKTPRAFVPDLLNPPTCLSSLPHQRRKNLRHRSLSVHHMSSQHGGSTEQHSDSSRTSPDHGHPTRTRASPDHGPPTRTRTSPDHRPPTRTRTSPDHGPPTRTRASPDHRPPTRTRTSPDHGPPTRTRASPDHRPPTRTRASPDHGPPTRTRTSPDHGPPTRTRTSPDHGPPTRTRASPDHGPPTRTRTSPDHGPPTSNTAGMVPIRAGGEGSAPDLHSSGLDSAAELLSALSPEERELLEAATAQGYPLNMAVVALQRTGHQSPDKVWSYLVACEHLVQLGYSMAQVEEALEMFQNCQTKAEEFLQLLSQFHEMGFQQNTIKEVLLVHENHRERALEELMTRVA